MTYDKFNANFKSDDLWDLGVAVGKATISLKQPEFSLKQYAKSIGQPNFSTFNKWKQVWVTGFLEKKHWSIFPGQNCLKQLRDEPPHSEMVVAALLETFGMWLSVENIVNAKWIGRHWVQMFLKKCASADWAARKMGSQGNMLPVTDLGEHAGNHVNGYI
jgi:hypothetical protein